MTKEEREDEMLRYIEYRQRYIQKQLPALRHKLKALEVETKRYNMRELAENLEHVNRAWDEAIDAGRANAGWPDVAGGGQ